MSQINQYTMLESVQETSQKEINQNQVRKHNNEDRGGDQFMNSIYEYREQGLMLQMSKGQILVGPSYNGFDLNQDFKIKNEFKSPSQFKTVQEARTYFFTRLLEMLFRQLEGRTAKNVSFNLIYIFFHFQYQQNLYLSINTLVKLSKNLKQSVFQKLTFSVSEYYLLELILQEFKKNNKEDVIDYSVFIKSNQMSQQLDLLFEDAATDIISFWSILKDENANVRKAYDLGMQISVDIKQIREFTKSLEEQELIKDYNKYYYYAMFYQNLLSDKQQYGQMVANLKNLIMIRNMRKKNTRFGVSYTDINDLAFCIMSYDDDKSVGRFTYCNKIASQILGVSEEQIIGESVLNIMPEMIRMNHDLFIKRFQQDGMPRIFGRVRNMFVKDFKDYIIPVQFFINFHYSSQFSYSIILNMDPIQSVTYYGTQTQIPIKYCVFLICNSDNQIIDLSSNASKLFGLSHKVKKEQEEIIGRRLKVEDVVYQFAKMENQIEVNGLQFLPNQIFKVRNFNQFRDESQFTFCSVTFNQVEYLHNYQGNFTENIYMIIPGSKVPDLDPNNGAIQALFPGGVMHPGINHQLSSPINSGNRQINKLDSQSSNMTRSLKEGEDDINNHLSLSVSSMSSTSSRTSSSSTLNNTKSLLFSQRSPRVLNLYLYIVFGVFFSFMLITSINFIIYMQKKNSVDLKIQFNQVVNKRNTYLATTLLNIKQLHLISFSSKINGTQVQNQSIIFNQSRFDLYSQELNRNRDSFQDYHNQYKQMEQLHSAEYGSKTVEFDIFNALNLSMVSEKGKIYEQSNTLDFGFSIFLTNLGMINTTAMMQENIPLNLKKYLLSKNDTKNVTPLMRSLYYLYENGLTSLTSLGSQQEILIQANTIKTSDESKLFVNLISFISIGVITLIGVFTFPLLGKIEDRKISVLKFFNLLTVDQIQDLIQRGKEFKTEFETMTRGGGKQKKRRDYDDDYQFQESGINNAIEMIEFRGGKTEDDVKSSKFIVEGIEKGENGSRSVNEISNIIKKIKDNEYNRDKRDYLKRKNKELQKMKASMGTMNDAFNRDNSNEEVKSGKLDKRSKKNLKDKALAFENSKTKKDSSKTKGLKKDDSKNKVKEEIKHMSEEETDSDVEMEKKSKKSKNLKELQQQYNIPNVSANTGQQNNSQSSRTEQIGVQLEKIALGEKLKLAFFVLIVLAFLNSCLFICFYLGQKTFQDDAKTLNDLSTIYQRENCLDNLMLFTMEQFVQNKSIVLNSGETTGSYEIGTKDAANYYLSKCQIIEQEYNTLRKNLPSFLINTQESIENLESSNLCFETYKKEQQKRIQCERVYDQIMKRGLTSTMYMIFNYAQQLTVRFQMDQGLARTQKFLYDKLLDTKAKDMVDLITYYMHDSLFLMDDLITTNALSYFQQLANYYKIIYVSYMVISVIMSFVFGLVIFRKLKNQIMTSANILVIMPLEDIEHKDRLKIETFLNS